MTLREYNFLRRAENKTEKMWKAKDQEKCSTITSGGSPKEPVMGT